MVTSTCLFVMTTLSLTTLSSASYFHVGGSNGWSSTKNVNYTQWSNSIHFQVDDVLIFEYDNKTENVIRVSPMSFKTCNVTAPIHQWSSGNDHVRLHRTGHFYFVSSLDGKCEGRKEAKVSVQVYENGHGDDGNVPIPVTPSTPSDDPDVTGPVVAPAPHHSSGVTAKASVVVSVLGVVMAVLSFGVTGPVCF